MASFSFNGPGERWGQRNGAILAGEEFDPRVAAGRRGITPAPRPMPVQFDPDSFPDYVPPKPDTSSLDAYGKALPQLFNTRGASQATQAAIRSMMGMGQSNAAAAGAAYGNRAMQVGASGMGAGFAQAQAMLPAYNKRAQMLEALQRLKLQARGGQAGAMGGVASEMARLAAQATMAQQSYATQQQQFGEGQRQFDLNRSDTLEQQAYARRVQQEALQRQLALGEPTGSGGGKVGAGGGGNRVADLWMQEYLNNQGLPIAQGYAQKNYTDAELADVWA